MDSRRLFLKKSLLTSTLLIPSVLTDAAILHKKKKSKGKKPLILSTWNHGMPANDKAWEVLMKTGNLVEAVEEGVKVT
jgi:N4-(beta-N-acetylglucosaminyl)-L-asparaginase